MKIKIQQFLFGMGHSWEIVGKNIAKQLINKNHHVDLISTNGIKDKYLDKDLIKFSKKEPYDKYDIQFSYTAPRNFPVYLDKRFGGLRLGMWCYEFDSDLPAGFSGHIARDCDYFCVPSQWFKDICLKNKLPEEKIIVIPHGVDWERFENAKPLNIKTDKKIKFLVNFAQPHIRKNIEGVLEAWGRAFTDNDDVCLVMKVKDKKPEQQFEINFSSEYNKFQKKFSNHAECKIYKEYIQDIESLYKACDCLFMLPYGEAFGLYFLEAMASGLIIVSPDKGGQMDFLNKENAFLVSSKEERAKKEAMYWNGSAYSSWYKSDINDAVDKLLYVRNNFDKLKNNIQNPSLDFKYNYSWKHNVDIIENLYKNLKR
jgi:glycosyltransferase involved in cell wall biosynthesis